MSPPEQTPDPLPALLFDPVRRMLRRDRRLAWPIDGEAGDAADFLKPLIRESLLDRLAMVRRTFAATLLIGAHDPALAAALGDRDGTLTIVDPGPRIAARAGARWLEGEVFPFAPATFDLILWPGGLESVNDVPGALIQCRRMLAPDGLLLGTFPGDGSWPTLRRILARADGDRAVARLHPQIDVAALGNLLQRCGLALPVADVEALALRYGAFGDMVRDLRAGGLGNALAGPVRPMGRAGLAAALAAFDDARDGDGRVPESVRLLQFSGWAPHPDQPKPARRGSAGASLAAALRPGG